MIVWDVRAAFDTHGCLAKLLLPVKERPKRVGGLSGYGAWLVADRGLCTPEEGGISGGISDGICDGIFGGIYERIFEGILNV